MLARPAGLPFLVFLMFLVTLPVSGQGQCLPPAECEDCELWATRWESPNDGLEVLVPGVSQTQLDGGLFWPFSGNAAGQTFRWDSAEPVLARLDVMMQHRSDLRPFSMRLSEWNDAPFPDGDGILDPNELSLLWEEIRSIPGPGSLNLISFFPEIPMTQGQTYFLELTCPSDGSNCIWFDPEDPDDLGEWGLARSKDNTDPFLNDQAAWLGDFKPWDIWFKTYSGPVGSAADPCICWSDSSGWNEPNVPTGSGPPLTAADFKEIVRGKADSPGCGDGVEPGGLSRWCALAHAFLYDVEAGHFDSAWIQLENASLYRKKLKFLAGLAGSSDVAQIDLRVVESLGQAFDWIGSTGSPEGDDEMVKRLLLHSGLVLESQMEQGVHNRTLALSLAYKLITDLINADEFENLSRQPKECAPGCGDPDCEAWGLNSNGVAELLDPACNWVQFDSVVTEATHTMWKDYAQQRYDDFLASMDNMEDSAHYNKLFWRYLLQLIALYDPGATIWAVPAFQDLIEREYQHHLPLGPVALFGDASGYNEDWGATAWLFAKAGIEYDDPRYKAIAHRAFDFQRSRVLGLDELWEAAEVEYASFAHAYDDVTESIDDSNQPKQIEELAATQATEEGTDWEVGPGGTGQTFEAAATPLVRVNVKARNLGDGTPGTVKIWAWNKNYKKTTGETPIYVDTFDLAGASSYTEISFFPFLEVSVGETYYVELSRNAAFELAGTGGNPGLYPGGHIYQNGKPKVQQDLWFETYTLSDNGSTITERLDVIPLRPTQRAANLPFKPYAFDTGTGPIPDKLVLRSGHAPEDLHVLVNLVAGTFGHAHMETGAIVAMTGGDSVLLSGSSISDEQPDATRPAVTRHYSSTNGPTQPNENNGRTFVNAELTDYRNVSVASVKWSDVYGFTVDHERRFFFVKNRFLLVRDHVVFQEPMDAATGTVWRASDVAGPPGPNWYDLFDRAPPGVRRTTNQTTTDFRNVERYVLLYLVERPGYEIQECRDPGVSDNPASPPFLISQQWQGDTAMGQSLWFDSILLPHGPEISPLGAAGSIEVLYDDGINVAFKIIVADETWFVVDKPDPTVTYIDAGEVKTDATYLIARTSAGEPLYILTQSATFAHIAGEPDLQWEEVTSVESGVFLPPPLPSCPAVTPCNESVHCLQDTAGPLSSSDTGLDACVTQEGTVMACGSQTVHLATYACVKESCCFTQPACSCSIGPCADGTYLECQ